MNNNSYDVVERLIKEHEGFEKLLTSDALGELEQFANSILAASEPDPEDAAVIRRRLNAILGRKAMLMESANERKPGGSF